MVRKFETVNESFSSFKPLLSKVLTKGRKNSTTTLIVPFSKNGNLDSSVSRGQRLTTADEFHIVLYTLHLLQTGKAFPVIRMRLFTINYFHSIVGYNPCPTSLSYNVPEVIKRILVYSATKKLPVTVSQLHKKNFHFGSKIISL